MKEFDHINARDLRHAASLLGEMGARAAMMAGGTDLLGVLKDRIEISYPDVVINLKTIAGLASLDEQGGFLNIGALTKLSRVAAHPIVTGGYGCLSAAALSVGSPQIRGMGTIGGNICQQTRCWYYRYPHQMGTSLVCARKGKGPCYAVAGDNRYHAIFGGKRCFAVCPSDVATALAALDGDIVIRAGETIRTVPVTAFYGPLGIDLKKGEIVTGVRAPKPPEGSVQSFLKFTLRKPIDFAVVSIASVLTVKKGLCTKARIVLGAVAPGPVRVEAAEEVLIGQRITEEIAEKAAEAALADARPLSRNAYKVEIAKTLVKRAITGEPSG